MTDPTPNDIARVCHDANRAWQQATGDPAVSPPWDDAPAWQRAAAIEGVRQALAGATPEQLHESWCEHKLADGWVYGPVKDAAALTHPCLVPYAELPEDQRRKDALFAAIVGALHGPDETARRLMERAADELEARLQSMRENGEADMRTAIWHVNHILRGRS